MLQCSISATHKEITMNADAKSAGDTVPDAPVEVNEKPENAIANFATLLQRGIERFVSLQKAALDAVGDQTADVSSTLRSFLKPFPAPAGTMLLDLTEQAVEGWINAQKNVLDLMVEQSAQAIEASKGPYGSPSESVAVLSHLVQNSAERTATAQKTILEFAAKQNKAASEMIQKQARVAGTPVAAVAGSVERGVAALIDTQKELVDTAAKMAETATGAKG
jgi:hypothetical protein